MEPLRYCHRKWYHYQGFRSQSACPRSLICFLCATPPVSRSPVSSWLPLRFCRRSFLLRAACSFVSYSYRSACRTLTTAHCEDLSFSFFLPWSLKTSARPISNDNLHTLPRFQRRPIYLLVFQGSHGNLILVVGFTLRCFQRLSRPYFASQLCPWQDNCCTSGTSTPVLSY